VRHHLLVCRSSAFEEPARRVWEDLGAVQQAISNRADIGVERAIRAAYGAFYTLLYLPVPLSVYEEEAACTWGLHPVRRRLKDLEGFTPVLREGARDLAEVY